MASGFPGLLLEGSWRLVQRSWGWTFICYSFVSGKQFRAVSSLSFVLCRLFSACRVTVLLCMVLPCSASQDVLQTAFPTLCGLASNWVRSRGWAPPGDPALRLRGRPTLSFCGQTPGHPLAKVLGVEPSQGLASLWLWAPIVHRVFKEVMGFPLLLEPCCVTTLICALNSTSSSLKSCLGKVLSVNPLGVPPSYTLSGLRVHPNLCN